MTSKLRPRKHEKAYRRGRALATGGGSLAASAARCWNTAAEQGFSFSIANQTAADMDSRTAASFVVARRVLVAACIALVLTAATLWTALSLVTRISTVLSQRRIIRQQIKDVDEYWQAAKKLPEGTPGFSDVTEAIRLVSADKETAEKAEAVATAALCVLKKTITDNVEHLSGKLSVIDNLQNEFEAEFGRRVEFRPGPPPTYDAGPKPPLLGPDNVRIAFDAYFKTGRSHERYAKWKLAHEACVAYNAANATLHPLIDKLQQDAAVQEQKQREAKAVFDTCVKRIEELRKPLKQFTESPPEIIPEVDKLRRRLANSWPVLAVFAVSDLMALVPCGIASVLAWSRVLLIAKGFSPRQLARG